MTRKHLPSIITALAAVATAGCAGPGGPSPTGPLAYALPSPPNATYQLVDTTMSSTGMAGMDISFGIHSVITLGLGFEQDPEGVRVTGIIEDLDVSTENEMIGNTSLDESVVSGSYELLLRRNGEQEIISSPEFAGMPDMSGIGAGMSLSDVSSIGTEILPRLPGRVVRPGDTWVDTLTQEADADGMESAIEMVVTYTLAGDTVVDGRAMLHIAMDSETTGEITMEMMGMSMTQSPEFTTTGLVLWDIERGLVAYAESHRSGSWPVEMPSPLPSGEVTITGSTRVRLERNQ